MRIHIPELNAFNDSYFDSYKAMYCMISYEVLKLNEKFQSRAINDIPGYQIGILMKIMRCFHSFMTVVENSKDYNTAASIIRIIADTIASFLLIYHDNSKDERLLRHYLFILDGCVNRLKELENRELKNNGSITNEEFNALKTQVQNAIMDTKKIKHYCVHTIFNLPIYTKNKDTIDIFVKDCNWKYSDIKQPKKKIDWNTMYQFIDTKKSMTDMISFLSHYVHGLSISNLIIDCNDDDFEPLISYGILLMGKIHEIANNDYGVDRSNLMDGFLDSEYGKDFLSYYSPHKLQELICILNEGKKD